jgi:predicted Rossmann fold nucleotide-binding protein DprA/Smf involved in DNA uptake
MGAEDLPNAVAAPATHILEWLALSLTSGLGPTKAIHRTFRHREAVFHASLTALESTGIKAVSAQSVATGKSAELAREEMARAAAAGVTVLSPEDACCPRG